MFFVIHNTVVLFGGHKLTECVKMKPDNDLSRYILGLNGSTDDLLSDIRDIIRDRDTPETDSFDSLQDKTFMDEGSTNDCTFNERNESYTVYDKDETDMIQLKRSVEVIWEEIVNIQNVLDMENDEKVAAFNRVGELVSELKKNQETLLRYIRSMVGRVMKIEEKLDGMSERKMKAMEERVEKQMEKKVKEMNKGIEARYESLNNHWEARFQSLEGRLTRIRTHGHQVSSGVQVVRNAPQLAKMTGKQKSRREIKAWIKQARVCTNQLNLYGSEAVEYVKDSLLEPALTRIRNANPKSFEEIEQKLLEAYVETKDELDKKRDLWCAEQKKDEDIWEYVDRINELEEEVEGKGDNSKEREEVKCRIFEKGLRNRKVALEVKSKLDDGTLVTLEDAGSFAHLNSAWHRKSNNGDFQVNMQIKGNKRGEERKTIRCWKCGNEGHVSYECNNQSSGTNQKVKDEQKAPSNEGHRGKHLERFAGKCWTCGEEGHPFFKCRNDRQRGDMGGNVNEEKVIREMAVGGREESDQENE